MAWLLGMALGSRCTCTWLTLMAWLHGYAVSAYVYFEIPGICPRENESRRLRTPKAIPLHFARKDRVSGTTKT
jgi:hypothetical protein